MTSAEDVNHWLEAIQSFDHSQYDDAILKFQSLNPTAKVMFNIGCCFLSSEDYARALQVRGYPAIIKIQDVVHNIKYIDLGLVKMVERCHSLVNSEGKIAPNINN